MRKPKSESNTSIASTLETTSDQLTFTDDQFIWRFSPNQTAPALLEAIFVGREPLLQNVLEKIGDSVSTGAKHQVLLYGPRGIGKSHFMTLLYHRLNRKTKLRKKIRLARLNEDETTTSMVQLLVRIYRSLCAEYPEEYSAQWLDKLLNQSPKEIEEVLTRRLVERFEKRTLVVIIENLNLLFENLGLDGQRELRTLLQEHPFASLIASSQQLFKAVSDRSEPFFGFFQQIPLKPLSLQDAHELLMRIAKSKKQDNLVAFLQTSDGRSRVRAIHDLAGGNHRVYIVLSEFMTRESLDQLVVPFEKMADDLTPYYQERLRWISPQQRQIIELLCRERGTLNPKEIARRLLVSEQTIGKQVRKLVEIGYLTAAKRGRETFYDLSEPLMRLAVEVKEQSLLVMLVDFLRIWYRPEQLNALLHQSHCNETCVYLDAALQRTKTHTDPRLELIQSQLRDFGQSGDKEQRAILLEEKAAVTETANDWHRAGEAWEHLDDSEKGLACYDHAIELNPKLVSALSHKARCLHDLNKTDDALTTVNIATSLDPTHRCAIANKATILHSLNRTSEAISCLDDLLAKQPEYVYGIRVKGFILLSTEKFIDALKCYEKLILINPTSAAAWYNKSIPLISMGRYEEAIESINHAVSLDPDLLMDAKFNLAEAMFGMRRWSEGLEAIREAFEMSELLPDAMGDVASMFKLMFSLSNSTSDLDATIGQFINIYADAAKKLDVDVDTSPIGYLGDGLVKSLKQIDANSVPATELQGYVQVIERHTNMLPELEVSVRLFRYGIRYLISNDPNEFVELIQPERHILEQALGIDSSKA